MWKKILSGIARKQTVRKLTPVVAAEQLHRQENFKEKLKKKETTWDSETEYGIYYAYPTMPDYYGTIGPFFSIIIIFLLIFCVGLALHAFGTSVVVFGWEYAVNEVKFLMEEARWYHLLGVALFALFMGSLLFVSPILTKYMENTVTIFSNKCIHVRRYLRKEKIVTYEELATSIKRWKICIKNGKYVIPCKGRDVAISMIGGEFPKALFRFLEGRCGFELPRDAENDRAGGTGLGWACGHLGGGICVVFGLVVSAIAFLFEGEFTWEKMIFDLIVNPMFGVAVGLVALGLLMNLITLPLVAYYYRKYRKTIRVSWMPVLIDVLILVLAIGGYMYMRLLVY